MGTASAVEVERSLRLKYPEKSFAFLAQLRNGTGYKKAQRYADAIVMSLWPSRGLHITGFEIKVHRSDWRNELKNGEKADAIAQHCHYWYIVAGDDKIVKLDELPPTWGLMVHQRAGKPPKIVKEAPINPNPTPIDYLFLASILRKQAADAVPIDELNSSVYREGLTHGRDLQRKDNERETARRAELEKSIEEFEKTSGLKINAYNGHRLGTLVKKLELGLNFEHKASSLRHAAEAALEHLKTFEKPEEAPDTETPPPPMTP